MHHVSFVCLFGCPTNLCVALFPRSDTAYGVRAAALHVWKTVVTNTPRTLGEVLPSLMHQVIESLAQEGAQRKGVVVVAEQGVSV